MEKKSFEKSEQNKKLSTFVEKENHSPKTKRITKNYYSFNKAFLTIPKSHGCSPKHNWLMKTSTTHHGNKISSLFCNVFGHHYVVSKKVTQHIKEYKCIHCQKQVTTDVSGKLSVLTPQMQEINNTLEDMYRKRRTKLVQRVA